VRSKLSSQRNECAQAGIAQEQPSSDQHSKNNWDEERIADAHKGSSRAATIAGQQDDAKNRRMSPFYPQV
jgi:hypothetical protein